MSVLIYADTVREPALRHEIPATVVDAFLYVEHDGHRTAVIGALDRDQVLAAAPGLEVIAPEALGLDEFLDAGISRDDAALEVAVRACERLGVRGATVPPSFPLAVADRLRKAGVQLEVDRATFAARRRRKAPAELEGIRRAQVAAEAGMAAAAALLRAATGHGGEVLMLGGEALTVEHIKVDVDAAFRAHGCSADEFIVGVGPQGALGHHYGAGPVTADTPVIVDLWPRDRASTCWADMTRTFVAGTPSAELADWHALCLQALQSATAVVRPGVSGTDLYGIVCDIFEAQGHRTQRTKEPGEILREGFFHGLGHGVGLEVHEAPALGRVSEPLVVGDVIAIEPGLYHPDRGGCRLEDLVLVTADGPELLTSYPYDLSP